MFTSVRTKLNLFVVALLVLCAAAVVGLVKTQSSSAATCYANNIMPCGFTSKSDFISKVKANAKGDYPAIYNYFSLSSSDYSRFENSARPGTVYADGRVVVDGQTVATDAWQIGRVDHSYDSAMSINGKTYYRSTVKDDFAYHKFSSQAVMVMFDNKGVAEFTVMNVCGNPVKGTNVTPKYSCDLLQKSTVAGKENTYSFTTKATATNNAKAVKYVYNFGDGTTATTTSASQAVQHTYTKAGSYTASVTVYVTIPGGQTVTTTSTTCKTVITVEEKPAPKTPFQQCVAVKAALLNKDELKYQFTVTTNQGNGSTFKSADFDFGDGTTTNAVVPTDANTASATHAYAKEGSYTTKVTVNFNTADGVKSDTCQTSIDTGITPPPTPPETPQVLPATGAGGVAGLFLGTSVLAGLGFRRFQMRNLRG